MKIFDQIDETNKGNMLKCLNAHTQKYHKGQFIFQPDADAPLVGIVLEGSVQMISEDMWGNTSLLSVIGPDELFGETFACASEDNYILTFQAVSECQILLMDYHRVLHTCNMACGFHHRLIENMVKIIAAKNLELIKKIDVVSKLRIREKILTYLSQCAGVNNANTFTIPMGRLKMAEYLCVDRSALTRELARMAEEGLIEYDKNTFTLKENQA